MKEIVQFLVPGFVNHKLNSHALDSVLGGLSR